MAENCGIEAPEAAKAYETGSLMPGKIERHPTIRSAPARAVALTGAQADCLAFIREKLDDCGFPPTHAEIAEHFGISTNAGRDRLKALVRKGAVRLHAGKARGIELEGR